MQPIRQAIGQELVWGPVEGTRHNFGSHHRYELKAGSAQLALLTFERPEGTLATASTTDGTLTFKRTGIWHAQVTVRAAGSGQNLALFEPSSLNGGSLMVEAGRAYHWVHEGLWQPEWSWQGPGGTPLVRFHNREGRHKLGAALEVDPKAAGQADLSLLVTLGWYLLVTHARDSEFIQAKRGG